MKTTSEVFRYTLTVLYRLKEDGYRSEKKVTSEESSRPRVIDDVEPSGSERSGLTESTVLSVDCRCLVVLSTRGQEGRRRSSTDFLCFDTVHHSHEYFLF